MNAVGENDIGAATQVLTDYYSAFSTACNKLDVQVVLPYFHEPTLLMSVQGVAAAPTHAALTPLLTLFMEGLRARGFARTELNNLHVKRLSTASVLASGVAVRSKVDGQELDRVGVTYILHKTNSGWRIAVLVVHDTDSVLELE
jgi:ketosteroid isomerase-like protein